MTIITRRGPSGGVALEQLSCDGNYRLCGVAITPRLSSFSALFSYICLWAQVSWCVLHLSYFSLFSPYLTSKDEAMCLPGLYSVSPSSCLFPHCSLLLPHRHFYSTHLLHPSSPPLLFIALYCPVVYLMLDCNDSRVFFSFPLYILEGKYDFPCFLWSCDQFTGGCNHWGVSLALPSLLFSLLSLSHFPFYSFPVATFLLFLNSLVSPSRLSVASVTSTHDSAQLSAAVEEVSSCHSPSTKKLHAVNSSPLSFLLSPFVCTRHKRTQFQTQF